MTTNGFSDGGNIGRIVGGTLPPDRFAHPKPPPPPSLEERQVKALERIAEHLNALTIAVSRVEARDAVRR